MGCESKGCGRFWALVAMPICQVGSRDLDGCEMGRDGHRSPLSGVDFGSNWPLFWAFSLDEISVSDALVCIPHFQLS